jgi:DNA-directed RNA polymerase subunit M/transcription elongation factor TFIIS
MPEHRFPCDGCGNQLVFAPGQTALVCPSCGHSQEIEAAPAEETAEALEEIDFGAVIRRLRDEAPVETTRVLACPNCGAETELPEERKAATCPFCATPLVSGAKDHRHIRPAALIPFRLGEAEARAAMGRWLGSLWFAPSGLRDYARQGRRMDGIYVPYWTFDAATTTRYRGQRGDNYMVTRRVMRGGKPATVTEMRIRWRNVSGRVARDFDDLLVLASHGLPRAHTEALEPWDLSQLVAYRPDYLSGFAAEGYQLGLEEGFAEARVKMDAVIEDDIRRDIGGDHQRIGAKATDIREVTFKHVLLPVWMAAYRFRGRSYRFVVNGQTGRVRGERPWSAWKIALALLVGLLLAAAALWLYREGGAAGW